MELYERVAYRASRLVIDEYSTSFSSSLKLFSETLQPHIAAIYGLVRIADEIVDTYRGVDAGEIIKELEAEVARAIERGYSTNPVVHAFAVTAREFGISEELIRPFFKSMQMDLHFEVYDKARYETYIYGSAEVIGLMCLRVFVHGDTAAYEQLQTGARALGAAYQKVNFLRDIAADADELGRIYFPSVSLATFDDAARDAIIADITHDFAVADTVIPQLPGSSQRAVRLSALYYQALLEKIASTPAAELKQKRVRIGATRKLALLWRANLTRQVRP